MEYQYWIGDMAAYVNEETRNQIGLQSLRLKRKHRQLTEINSPGARRTTILNLPSNDSMTPTLTLETTTARFKLRLVRRDGEPHRNLKPSTQQSKVAIGDQWTLIGHDGNPLRDEAGEYPSFEKTDSFFRVKPKYSQLLIIQGNEGDFMFLERWPAIRDSAQSKRWLYEKVSAVLVIRDEEATACRLASILLKAEDWYAMDPKPEVVNLT